MPTETRLSNRADAFRGNLPYFRSLLAVSLVFGSALFFVLTVARTSAVSVAYPVPELGNCGSQEECKAFCDVPENQGVCIDFAERTGVFESKEAGRMRDLQNFEKQVATLGDSPGGCISPRECDAYCRIEGNIEECLSYGVKHGFTTQEEADKNLERARRGGPGGCKSEQECRSYCMDIVHEDECLAFSMQEGNLTEEDAALLKKAREIEQRARRGPEEKGIDEERANEILKTEAGPGGCTTSEECQTYCSDTSKIEECMGFAVKHNIATPQTLEFMKRMIQLGSSGPGGCTSRESCEQYCSVPDHGEACMLHTIKQGLVTSEEADVLRQQAEIIKRVDRARAVQGPSGCATPDACNAYCRDLAHVEECIDYAARGGALSGDVVQQMMGQSAEAKEKFRQMEEERAKFMQQDGNEWQVDGGMGMPGQFQQQGQEGFFVQQEGMMPRQDSSFPQGEMMPGVPMMNNGPMPDGFAPDGMKNLMQTFEPMMLREQFGTPPDGAGAMPQGSQQFMMPSEGQFMQPPSDMPAGGEPGSFVPPPGGGEMAPPPPEGGVPPSSARSTFFAGLQLILSPFLWLVQ